MDALSIYRTLWVMPFRLCKGVTDPPDITVLARGVRAGQAAAQAIDFLPPAEPAVGPDDLRAVVFVTDDAVKGTPRSPQEYSDPILVLTGREYNELTMPKLYDRLQERLRQALTRQRQMLAAGSTFCAPPAAGPAPGKTLSQLVAERMEADPHVYEARPCATCSAISVWIDAPFGCVKKQRDAAAPAAATAAGLAGAS